MPPATQPNETEPDETEEIGVTQLLLMYSRQERVTLSLYNFRILGSLGVLGFVYQNPEFTYNWIVKIGISLGFILFAAGNGYGAVASQTITSALSKALKKTAKNYGYTRPVLLAHSAISRERMTFYQVGLTLIALVLLWFPNIAQLCKRIF